jgi:ADP-ribosylglycohydrolase
MNDFRRRARNALLGLAMGDSIGWPSMFHRARLLPAWTRRIRREMDAEREDAGVLRVPMPFSLNGPADLFDLLPTDDTEWAAWTILNLLKNNCIVEQGWISGAWLALAQGKDRILGGVSTVTALANIRRGLMPPRSGNDNPHYFDDGALCRAVPVGIAYAGRPSEAARAAGLDACATNSEDGVWVAQSVAAAVSAACAGESIGSVMNAALEHLPEDSWSRRSVRQALDICAQDEPVIALYPSLHALLNREYSDGCVGPETLALALGIVSKLSDRFVEAVTIASSFAKGADAVPSVVGAIAGAMAAGDPVPRQWERALSSLKGICLPFLAGKDYLRLIDTFVAACPVPRPREEKA